ncbi:exosome complex component [Raphidocelis subcapitata]|uniref:Exosome complex component n=1 Tax=Raphidocelis subcapitata TaxID=307507 RepID=A0A2V0P6Q9_9CHLO|nr:exosome complex component [Raphidocelis subcapitata]|eukprot:GBF95259.1 exosome complex component [Raphidocelis subcapitata]
MPPGADGAEPAGAAALVGRVAAPGDEVLLLPPGGRVAIGSSGLRPSGGAIVATKSGVVRRTRGGQLWIEGRQKRYIPAEGDCVVGVVVDRMSEHFTVDIAGPFKAVLPMLSFENATKRNRPAIYEGDAVFARVAQAHPDMDPVLTCVDGQGRASNYGHLKGGHTFECSCAWARALLEQPPPAVVAALGAEVPFEMAVGLNGRVWIDAPSAALAVRAAGALRAAEEELGPGGDAGAFVKRALAGGGAGG